MVTIALWMLMAGAQASDVIVPSAATGSHAPSEPPILLDWRPGDGPRGPRPKSSPARWFSTEDYDTEMLQGGTTEFTLNISMDGSVTGCDIDSGSGEKLLDERTCEIMLHRSQFSPALSSDGKPVSSRYRSRVRWQMANISQQPLRFGTHESTVQFILGKDGLVRDCIKVVEQGGLRLKGAYEEKCPAPYRFEPFRDAKGDPVEKRVRAWNRLQYLDAEKLGHDIDSPVSTQSAAKHGSIREAATMSEAPRPWRLGDGPRDPRPKKDPDSWIVFADYPKAAITNVAGGVTAFTLRIGSDGSVTHCDVDVSAGEPGLDKQTCDLLLHRGRFDPALDADGTPKTSRFHHRVVWDLNPYLLSAPRPLPLSTFAVEIEFTLDADGRARDCLRKGGKGESTVNRLDAARCLGTFRFEPFRDDAGRPVAKRVRYRADAGAVLLDES